MLEHYVFIRFKQDTPQTHVDEFCQRILALPNTINELHEVQIGHDIVREARSWDLMIRLHVDDIDALIRYQVHPDHQAVVQFNAPFVADIGVIDFEAFN